MTGSSFPGPNAPLTGTRLRPRGAACWRHRTERRLSAGECNSSLTSASADIMLRLQVRTTTEVVDRVPVGCNDSLAAGLAAPNLALGSHAILERDVTARLTCRCPTVASLAGRCRATLFKLALSASSLHVTPPTCSTTAQRKSHTRIASVVANVVRVAALGHVVQPAANVNGHPL